MLVATAGPVDHGKTSLIRALTLAGMPMVQVSATTGIIGVVAVATSGASTTSDSCRTIHDLVVGNDSRLQLDNTARPNAP